MGTKKKLPIGIENFEVIRTEDFYYVDKTGLIKELLDNWGYVNLFTRPRRFGKSLNMSMLKTFFEYGCDKSLFEGLKIEHDAQLCEEYMGKFPVISISLKGVSGENFDEARAMMCSVIGREAMRFAFLKDSDVLSAKEKNLYTRLISDAGENCENFVMADAVLMESLLTLSGLLCRHYGHKVIILIDEYDVPLDKAQQYGYYEKMLHLIRNMFGQALKTNESLHFAVMTGCLRISKESVFTGLNNLKVLSITNIQFDEHFGFTDAEVLGMLRNYGLEEYHEIVKDWYDGYHFGDSEVYCPWDVINYVENARVKPGMEPLTYWINTSENNILRTFFQMATKRTIRDMEKLINGESVRRKIIHELTYKELYDSLDNLWSVLFMTGYLTQKGSVSSGGIELSIPNLEVKQIFVEQILRWFESNALEDTQRLDAFCMAFQKGDGETVQDQMNVYLSEVIGIHDYSVKQELKENYYHGLLDGLLMHCDDWGISSNVESGEGYSDIQLEVEDRKLGIIIEVKCPRDGNLVTGCMDALKQISEKKYEERLINDGMTKILKYGIAFYKKTCKVIMEE